jgi:hypothetical protein
MIAIAKPVSKVFHLPRLPVWNLKARARRRATMDLIHSSPHLLRDIGVGDGTVVVRGR